jgi:CBS domain-containing protein
MLGIQLPRVSEVMEKQHLPIVAADIPIRKAAEVMLANRLLATVTLDAERRPALVFTFRRLVKSIAEGVNIDEEQIAKHAVTDPVVIRQDDTIAEALEVMRREMIRFLPVVDNRNKLVGVVEPRHIAFKLWKLIPYGTATIEARIRRPVVVSADLSIKEAAKAMDANGVTELFVRKNGELFILREWDFLEAVVKEENLDHAKVGDYARGEIIRVPADFDARAAVELMQENNVQRLVVEREGTVSVITVTDLAFAALNYLEKLQPKTVALVLANVEPGREDDVARKVAEIEQVTEVLSVPGIYDLVIRVEAPTVDEVAEVITKSIRSLREIRDTMTLIATPKLRKKG